MITNFKIYETIYNEPKVGNYVILEEDYFPDMIKWFSPDNIHNEEIYNLYYEKYTVYGKRVRFFKIVKITHI